MLPDDYIRKMKQALEEVEAEIEDRTKVEAESRHEPVGRPGASPPRRTTSESYYEPFPDE